MSALNPKLGPDPTNHLVDSAGPRPTLSRYELHNIYREMVQWELANGRLSSWRRRKLIRYAASLNISPLEAGELIQEAVRAREAAGQAQAESAPLRVVDGAAHEAGWPLWGKLAAAIGAVALVKLVALAVGL